jgi:hypothetical protein
MKLWNPKGNDLDGRTFLISVLPAMFLVKLKEPISYYMEWADKIGDS